MGGWIGGWINSTITNPYVVSALTTVAGIFEITIGYGLMVTGAGLITCAGWTGIGAAWGVFQIGLGGLVFLHGCDTTAAGVAGLLTGKVQDTFTKKWVTQLTGSELAGTLVDLGIPLVGGLAAGLTKLGLRAGLLSACFAAGTPLLTPDGSRPIEQFKPGDFVLARSEFNPNGPVEPKIVEETFVTIGRIVHLHVNGQVIRTTTEHPFWVYNRGWLPARELQIGDRLVSHDGKTAAVEDLLDTGELETVYNLRVADHHTYFVGGEDWGFWVWAHNACGGIAPVLKGRDGMALAGLIQNPRRIISLTGAAFRVPDGLNRAARIISEVKNWNPARVMDFTRQLRDFAAYAKLNGYRFDLWVNRGQLMTPDLLNAIERGWINIRIL